MNNINAATSIYALLGYPVGHSLSPRFWNSAFSKLNMNAVYVALSVKPEDIFSVLDGLKKSSFKGVNVTRPHKFESAKYCDILHEAAADTKIVNTIKFCCSSVEGWNTDATGFLNLIKRYSLPRTKTLVIGNGASARSIIWALNKYEMKQIIQIARKFSDEFDEKAIENNSDEKKIIKISWNCKNFNNSIKESDIIINTTPIGWKEDDDIPGFSEFLDDSKVFVDLNYSNKSKLLYSSREKCGLTLDGRELLYEQGLEAFKILTNYAPPAEVIKNSIFD